MNAIESYFKEGELALAAYAELFFSITGQLYTRALEEAGMSPAQAEQFKSNWRVVEQYDGKVETPYVDEFGQEQVFLNPTGLNATVFEERTKGVSVI